MSTPIKTAIDEANLVEDFATGLTIEEQDTAAIRAEFLARLYIREGFKPALEKMITEKLSGSDDDDLDIEIDLSDLD